MEHGHFSPDGREFVITSAATPRPWINFLTNEEYSALVSSTGGGYSFYKDSKTERLLNFSGPNLMTGRPGRYIFVRDNEKGSAFSITYEPLRVSEKSFQCRVGLGYQIIQSGFDGILGEVTYFVPLADPCEIWKVKVKNKSKKVRNLSIFGYLEWFIGSTDYLNFYNISLLWNRVNFDEEIGAILARKTAFYEEFNIKNNPYVAFFSTSQKVDGWDTHKEKFLGVGNTCENPQGVLSGKCTQSVCDGEEGVGVLQHNITLQPGEEKTITFCLGQTAGKEKAKQIIQKYKDAYNVDEALQAVKLEWEEKLSPIQIETPDPKFNVMVNTWVKYQLYMCNYWSRSPSFYHEGQGGRGYRDSCQDADGIMSINSEYAKNKILKIATLIRRDGTCAPGWSDTYGPYPNRPFKDHPAWFVNPVIAYVKETGDFEFLNEKVPWLKDRWQKGGTEIDPAWQGGAAVDGEGTIFEHILAQLNFTYNDVSVHGLPRVGEADWNDALDMAGRRQIGESVWLAMALVRSLKLAIELADQLKEDDIAADLRQKAEVMTQRINEHGWDVTPAGGQGEWYLAGYNDDRVPFGSSQNKEGQIFLNSQSWAILAGIVPPDRLTMVLKAVEEKLNGPHGLALLAPAYTVFDPGLGRIAMFSPGTKENAAVFCHAATFMAAAYAKLGMGNKVYETLKKIMPNQQENLERYKAEPYVYAEYLVGPEHPYRYGEGAYTWLTGTAGWTFMVATELMLGARREFGGLLIDPTIPSDWPKCKITRPFRGATYEITIKNPHGVEHGVKSVSIDGKKIEGNLIPSHADGKVHRVEVIMG